MKKDSCEQGGRGDRVASVNWQKKPGVGDDPAGLFEQVRAPKKKTQKRYSSPSVCEQKEERR